MLLLGAGKITSVTRTVGEGFTKGRVLVSPEQSAASSAASLLVTFENENLCCCVATAATAATSTTTGRRMPGREDREVLLDADVCCCPDLITLLDRANGAPLGVADYRYGVKVSVVALRAPPVWTTEEGLRMGGPAAFG